MPTHLGALPPLRFEQQWGLRWRGDWNTVDEPIVVRKQNDPGQPWYGTWTGSARPKYVVRVRALMIRAWRME